MGIAERVELYNQAFRLACDHIAKDNALTDRAGLVKHLHDAVRGEISAGQTDPVVIATNAIRVLQTRQWP